MTDKHRIPLADVSTLSDVAALARVSPATVSRAFNQPQLLNPETRERVRAAAASLRYAPDGLARSLRSKRSKVIGAVMPALRHAYFASTVEGLQLAIARQGYTLLLATSEFDPKTELSAIESMIRQGVDGLVLVGMQHDPELLPLLRARGKPFVITWSYDPTMPSVGFNHRRAIAPLVGHLLDLGHRDIVTIMAFLEVSDRERDRLAGIGDVFRQRGLDFSSDRVFYARGSGLQDGRNAFRAARKLFPKSTAVICANDLLASGVLMECAARGLNVPLDLSVTGYGDLDIAAAMTPSITTVQTPSAEMGRIAADCLLAKLASQDAVDHIELETTLIVRASTGPVPNRALTGGDS